MQVSLYSFLFKSEQQHSDWLTPIIKPAYLCGYNKNKFNYGITGQAAGGPLSDDLIKAV